MRLIRALLALAAVSCGSAPLAAAPSSELGFAIPAVVSAEHEIRVDGVIVNAVDGDTADVAIAVRSEATQFAFVVRVRLLANVAGRGCWAPESHLQGSIADPAERISERNRGIASKRSLAAYVGHRCVVVIPIRSREMIDYMTMERILAVVEVDGKSIGQQQIRSKLASSTKGGKLGE